MQFHDLKACSAIRVLIFGILLSGVTPFMFASGDEDPEEALCDILVPRAISPNGDGINDLLEVKASCQFVECIFTLFDARERIVFQTTAPNPRWDATNNGKPVPEGHYTWEFSYRVSASSAKAAIQRGMLTIIR